ncbi:hypothetical protein DD238_003963 [Peronospora effusa]|uniref:Uncharacterized protein n=1 Tax=Peronospora effusa TaxID=542832 RepID=A0A3M6VIQ1_9STRA|nr:hypothetical protein DD238_003963 [Peronospora effusa]
MLDKLDLVRQHGHVTVDSGSNNKTLFEAFDAKADVTFLSDQMHARDGLKVFGNVKEDEENVEKSYIMRIAAIVNNPDGAHVNISTVYGRIKSMAKHMIPVLSGKSSLLVQ